MTLNYLTEVELELTGDEVNLQISEEINYVISILKNNDIIYLLDKVRAHEKYLIHEKWRELQLQKLDEMKQSFIEMDSLYAELKKIPWYHFSERKAQKQKIEALRIKQRGW